MTEDTDLIRLSDLDDRLWGGARRLSNHFALDGEPLISRYEAEMLARTLETTERLPDLGEKQ
jgi:hypothetical protein